VFVEPGLCESRGCFREPRVADHLAQVVISDARQVSDAQEYPGMSVEVIGGKENGTLVRQPHRLHLVVRHTKGQHVIQSFARHDVNGVLARHPVEAKELPADQIGRSIVVAHLSNHFWQREGQLVQFLHRGHRVILWPPPHNVKENVTCDTGAMANFADQLRGDRLELHRWTPAHLLGLLEAVQASYDELHLWMNWAANPPTVESVRDVIVNAQQEFDANEKWSYGLFEITTSACVGSAGLRRADAYDELEIGYWIRTDRTGRGYATEAARVLTTAAFARSLDVARVRISMDVANDASARVPCKLGYRLEGETSRELRAPGQTGRGALWTVAREQWGTRKNV
jgi:RimJ/RimL family protein N-acetyltransferase